MYTVSKGSQLLHLGKQLVRKLFVPVALDRHAKVDEHSHAPIEDRSEGLLRHGRGAGKHDARDDPEAARARHRELLEGRAPCWPVLAQ